MRGAGEFSQRNGVFVSVTACEPWTTRCRTINNVLLDMGSVGLRVFASALTGLNPPAVNTTPGAPLAECYQNYYFGHRDGGHYPGAGDARDDCDPGVGPELRRRHGQGNFSLHVLIRISLVGIV